MKRLKNMACHVKSFARIVAKARQTFLDGKKLIRKKTRRR